MADEITTPRQQSLGRQQRSHSPSMAIISMSQMMQGRPPHPPPRPPPAAGVLYQTRAPPPPRRTPPRATAPAREPHPSPTRRAPRERPRPPPPAPQQAPPRSTPRTPPPPTTRPIERLVTAAAQDTGGALNPHKPSPRRTPRTRSQSRLLCALSARGGGVVDRAAPAYCYCAAVGCASLTIASVKACTNGAPKVIRFARVI